MNVLLLNGNPDPAEESLEAPARELASTLQTQGQNVSTVFLRDLAFSPCTGCFSCWVKTPGQCVFRDDFTNTLPLFVGSDLVLFLFPLIRGYPAALLKKAIDRSIPVLLPYIDTSTGECRHYQRYDQSPDFGFFYSPEADTDDEDLNICATLLKRFARNAGARVRCFRSLREPVLELCRELADH